MIPNTIHKNCLRRQKKAQVYTTYEHTGEKIENKKHILLLTSSKHGAVQFPAGAAVRPQRAWSFVPTWRSLGGWPVGREGGRGQVSHGRGVLDLANIIRSYRI